MVPKDHRNHCRSDYHCHNLLTSRVPTCYHKRYKRQRKQAPAVCFLFERKTMAYTYGGNKTKSNYPTSPSNFSNLQNDGQRTPLPYGNFMQSKDATASPVLSPATSVSGSGAVLTVPQNAAQFTISSSVTCQVGEDSTYTYGITIPANTPWTFDVANQQYIYLKPSSGTNTIQFYFNCI
jgi:hypothetical protein